LVPLVKAFRPVAPAEQDCGVALPRLAGMLNSRLGNFAVLENPAGSGRYFFLRKHESHAGVTLANLKPRKGLAKLEFVGAKSNAILRLQKSVDNRARSAGVFGFLDRLSQSLEEVPQRLVLEEVNTDLMLFLYSQFTERTLLCSPGLPAASFDLKAGASHRGDLAFRMKWALQANGIVTIKYGDKFLLVVAESEAAKISSRLPDRCSRVCDPDTPDLYPGGVMVNFDNADLAAVLALYAQVAGRALSPALDPQGFDVAVDFTTQTPLTREDCAHALETLLWLHDLKVVPVGSDSFTLVPMADPAP